MMRLFIKSSTISIDIDVFSWMHHYRTYNKMSDRLANIAMDTGDSIQVGASLDQCVIKEATDFLDDDVNHWLEASHADQYVILGPALTPRDQIASRQESARRRSAVCCPRPRAT